MRRRAPSLVLFGVIVLVAAIGASFGLWHELTAAAAGGTCGGP